MATIDFATLLQQAILSVNPQIDVSDSSQISELVIRPLRAYMANVEALIQRDEIVRDIRRYREMSDSELESLAANFFVTRKLGAYATGRVFVYYLTPQDVSLPIGQQFFSTSGAVFISTTQVSLKSAQVSTLYDPVKSAYAVEVTKVRSLGTGPTFNVGAGDIASMANQTSNVVLVTNPEAFVPSIAGETKDQLAVRIPQGASQRNLCSADSARAFFNDDPRVLASTIIGAGDNEMYRDILYGVHINGAQDAYIYSAAPLTPYVVEQNISVPGLPVFAFLGPDLSGTVVNNTYPPYAPDRSGPVVFIQKVEYGTGSGGSFVPAGLLLPGQDYLCSQLALGLDANKNSVNENWQLAITKRPPSTATRIRATVLRAPIVAALQASLAASGARAAAQTLLIKHFFTAVLDVSIALRPVVGASTDPAFYAQVITNLIATNPIASQIAESDVVAALVANGAGRVDLPFTSNVRVFYPDLTQGTATFRGSIDMSTLENGQATVRTMALYPGNISITIT